MADEIPTRRLSKLPAKTPPIIRRALMAVYGEKIPIPETIQIDSRGRSRARIGPIPAWLTLSVSAVYDFPDRKAGEFADRGRWDSSIGLLGMTMGRVEQTYDGEVGYQRVGKIELRSDEKMTESLRRRLWADSISLLFPLIGSDYEVRDLTERTATLVSEDGDPVAVEFGTVQGAPISLSYERYQADGQRYVTVRMEFDGLKTVNSLPVLTPVRTIVDGLPMNEAQVESVVFNPSLDKVEFVLR